MTLHDAAIFLQCTTILQILTTRNSQPRRMLDESNSPAGALVSPYISVLQPARKAVFSAESVRNGRILEAAQNQASY